ncbi:MAG TPA: hypothetical protein PLS53_00235 [Thermoanaerobaculaceae bacterium]|nr:hypothetical protein [Thermoanaerobaculaceae bacterium]HPS76561.1 hypothetical protein [Thermoanaerobaculaceae bacterium]
MSLRDAADLIAIDRAKQDIVADESLSLWGRMKAIQSIDAAAAAQPEPGPMITFQDVVKGAIGAGLGYGVGSAVGSFLSLSPGSKSTLKALGAGLGTLMNTGVLGMNKTAAEELERDIRAAVRYGFLKGAYETGLLDHAEFLKHGAIAITPETLTAPVKMVSNVTSSIGSGTGAAAAGILGDDETDEKISKIMLEKRLTERQADRLRQQRKNRLVAAMLSKRLQAAPSTTRY